jgi:putative inorganic carbon (HCO3(-)) transporter
MIQKSLRKIILYGMPVLYFLIAVSFYFGTYDTAQIKITIFHAGGLFLIMSWIVLKIQEGDFGFFKNKILYILPVLLFLLSGALSFFLSPYKLASLNEFIRRFIYCGIVFVIVDEFDDDKKLIRIQKWLIITTCVVCLYGLIQILDYYFLRGLDPFWWRGAFGNRIMSSFGNPNFFGDFLIVMSPIVLAVYIRKRKFLLMFLWLLIVACVYQTLSKGAWLGFASGFFVFTLTYVFVFFRHKLSRKIIIVASICILTVMSVVGYGICKKTFERTDSVSFRVFTWLSTWEMINTNPVLGTGIGTFYLTYPLWRRPQIFFIEGNHSNESDHPENEYLEIWHNEGIVGLTIFFVLVVVVFVAGYKNMVFMRSNEDTRKSPLLYIQLGVTSAFSAQLIHDCICVSLRFVSSGVMLWLMIGTTLSISANFAKKKGFEIKNYLTNPVKIILQAVVVAVFGCAIIFTIRYFIADRFHAKSIGFQKIGNPEAAIAMYDKVNKYNPTNPMTIYYKALIYADRWGAGDAILAERTFEKLWKLAPNYVQSKYLAAAMYSKLFVANKKLKKEYIDSGRSADVIACQEKEIIDSYNKAVKYYKQSLEIDPICPLTYHGLALLYAQVGNLAQAEKTLLSHLEYPNKLQRSPHNFWVEDWAQRRIKDYSATYTELGNLYLMHGKPKEAKNAYLKALSLNPGNINAKKNVSLAYKRLGDVQNSNRQWMEIYKMNPDDEDALEHLKLMKPIQETGKKNNQ